MAVAPNFSFRELINHALQPPNNLKRGREESCVIGGVIAASLLLGVSPPVKLLKECLGFALEFSLSGRRSL